MKQTLTIGNRVNLTLASQPVRQGVPWPRGVLRPGVPIVAADEGGTPVPVATRALNHWPDGSVQWSLVDLSLDLPPSGTRTITVVAGGESKPPPINHPVEVHSEKDRVKADNGLVAMVICSHAGMLVESWHAGARHVTHANGFDILLTDPAGAVFSVAESSHKRVYVEDANPLRAIVRVEGKHQAEDGRFLLDFWLRFTVTAGRADVKVTYHYRNREKAEPGIVLRTMAMRLHSALPVSAPRAIVHAARTRDFRTEPYRLSEDFEIVASNTPDLATYAETHKGITGGGMGRVFLRQHQYLRDDEMKKPWFLRNVSDFKFGGVFPPEWGVWSQLGLVSAEGSLLVLGGNMAGLHPKSLVIAGDVIRYFIWPEWAGPFEITQGEGRTLDFFVGPLPAHATDAQLMAQYFSWEFGNIYGYQGTRPPLKISLDPAHVRSCAVFGVEKLPAYDPDAHFAFERKVKNVWTPDQIIPPTGHWHYGDSFHSWGVGANNEEMLGWMWFQEYLRSGRPECLDVAMAQTQHIADVDMVAYSNDPYQNGGMCAHGPRHNHCAAYPSHMWFTEMLVAYALTGDEEFKRAAVTMCDCLTFWINDPVGFGHVGADGRESGQPLINLAWTHQFVPDKRYLDAMMKVVRGSFMEKVKRHGRLTYMKPREDLPLIRYDSYGEWAAWEGLYWAWELTRDEELKKFILGQLEWRLEESRMGTHGIFREMDYNVAAYAYFMTGDRAWLDRVSRAFRVAFRAASWQFGWIKAMYYIKLAFEHGIVRDEEVLVS